MLNPPKQPLGFSLIELLVAMAIGLGAITSLASFVGNAAASNSKFLNLMRLNEELSTVANLITTELQRSGFYGDIGSAINTPQAFKDEVFQPVVISRHPQEETNSCILFAFDKDKNGSLEQTENYGFRIHNKAIEMRQAGAGCAKGGWQDLTDSSVTIVEQLQFTLIFKSHSVIAIRMQLSASVKRHTSINKQITREVFVYSGQQQDA